MTKKAIKKGLPWYRYRSVWILLVAVPLLTLMGSAATIYIAVTSSESRPHDSYFKKGLSPNELAPREEKAKQLGLSADLSVDQKNIVIKINQPVQDTLALRFLHPTLEKYDFGLSLSPVNESHTLFTVPVPKNLREHKWDIFLDAKEGQWRIKGRLLNREDHIQLLPFGQ